jgi:hypothetical protein
MCDRLVTLPNRQLNGFVSHLLETKLSDLFHTSNEPRSNTTVRSTP